MKNLLLLLSLSVVLLSSACKKDENPLAPLEGEWFYPSWQAATNGPDTLFFSIDAAPRTAVHTNVPDNNYGFYVGEKLLRDITKIDDNSFNALGLVHSGTSNYFYIDVHITLQGETLVLDWDNTGLGFSDNVWVVERAK